MKKYIIKNLSELENIITLDNYPNFVFDFATWLSMVVAAKHQRPQVLIPDFTKFQWIDDGKHDVEINLKEIKK